MKVDTLFRYDSPDAFFDLNGSVVMRMTASAAIAVCDAADAHGFVIVRVEGGIWHNPGFEARVDCIWDGTDPPVCREVACRNNLLASKFISEELATHDTFILMSLPMDGAKCS